MLLDCLLDAVKDSLIALPFLFLAYLLIEALEKHTDILTKKFFSRSEYFSPAIGSLLGLIPQCGFSAAVSNLYVSGVVGVGTLISVFLATSDEAVLIMLSSPGSYKEIIKLLAAKLITALVFGYLFTFIFKKKKKEIDDICRSGHCGCESSNGIVKPALIHTGKILIWIFCITFALNIAIELIGTDSLTLLLGGSLWFQPFITALIGLIPNCAVSVLFTELYLAGSLSFASAVSGLASGAGVGLIVLFKMNKNRKESILITVLLYGCAAVSGLVLKAAEFF